MPTTTEYNIDDQLQELKNRVDDHQEALIIAGKNDVDFETIMRIHSKEIKELQNRIGPEIHPD
ncbi:hypothetical protein LCGC14_0380480 [marine sediment metagenome]|uniref:Uncharacterized protein n=1 Tax=marine sediment metagenome TaxID=412755 RepID=A0A0F9TKL9_9ZZZZ